MCFKVCKKYNERILSISLRVRTEGKVFVTKKIRVGTDAFGNLSLDCCLCVLVHNVKFYLLLTGSETSIAVHTFPRIKRALH